MAKSRSGLIATGIGLLSFVLIAIAFATPYWLETDGELKDPKFNNIGLWTVCFAKFEEPHFWYDTVFDTCWWIFEEEFYIINNFLLRGFFVAVQLFFTFCFTLHIIAMLCAALYMMCSRENDKFIHLLLVLGTTLLVSALCGTIAVYIFGAYGDGRDWMPHWEHNDIGWSYALAVIGVIGTYTSGTLYLIEARRHAIKRRNADKMRASYHMEAIKGSSHSDI